MYEQEAVRHPHSSGLPGVLDGLEAPQSAVHKGHWQCSFSMGQEEHSQSLSGEGLREPSPCSLRAAERQQAAITLARFAADPR